MELSSCGVCLLQKLRYPVAGPGLFGREQSPLFYGTFLVGYETAIDSALQGHSPAVKLSTRRNQAKKCFSFCVQMCDMHSVDSVDEFLYPAPGVTGLNTDTATV